uniref:Uncharacterized protein n=1 Tax=Setaria italica TaxID=4555 RepID=K4ALA7_SETIT
MAIAYGELCLASAGSTIFQCEHGEE